MKQNGNKMETNGNQNELKVKINKILLFQFLSILYKKESIL